jgi:hypothetical protein
MTRIHIEDLPRDTELTPEELDRLLGAGRPSFRPTIETLEGREMYAANLAGSLAPVALAPANEGHHGALVHQVTLENEIHVGGPAATATSGALGAPRLTAPTSALDAALWGGHEVKADEVRGKVTSSVTGQDIPLPPGVPPVSGPVTWGQWENTAAGGHRRSGTGAGGVHYGEEITKDNGFNRTTTYTQGAQQGQKKEEHWVKGLYDVKVWNNQGWLILEGRESAQNHTWTVRKWDDKGVLQSTEVYDKVGGKLIQVDRLLKDGQVRYHGQVTDKGQWIETYDNFTNSAVAPYKVLCTLYTTQGGKEVYRTTLWRDGHFTEESWDANGRYVKNVWTKRDHGLDANSKDHISETIWTPGGFRSGAGLVTVTLFHKSGYYEVSSNGWGIGPSTDAKVTYVYAVDASGKVLEWFAYNVQEMDPSWKGWGIHWSKQPRSPDRGSGAGGWWDADGYKQPDGSKWGLVDSWTMAKFGMAPTALAYTHPDYTWLSRDPAYFDGWVG